MKALWSKYGFNLIFCYEYSLILYQCSQNLCGHLGHTQTFWSYVDYYNSQLPIIVRGVGMGILVRYISFCP